MNNRVEEIIIDNVLEMVELIKAFEETFNVKASICNIENNTNKIKKKLPFYREIEKKHKNKKYY